MDWNENLFRKWNSFAKRLLTSNQTHKWKQNKDFFFLRLSFVELEHSSRWINIFCMGTTESEILLKVDFIERSRKKYQNKKMKQTEPFAILLQLSTFEKWSNSFLLLAIFAYIFDSKSFFTYFFFYFFFILFLIRASWVT